MSYFRSYLSGPVADALGWTLLHAIWQGFALVLPAALVLHFLQNRSSALRYRVSVLTLLTQVLLSAATFAWYYQPALPPFTPVSSTTLLNNTASINWQTVSQTIPWHQQLQQFLETHLSQFVLIYLIGVVLFGLRLAGGWVYLQRLSQTATQPTTAVWAHLIDKLQVALSTRTVVQIRESVQIATPMIIGVLKPILLVPIGLATHLSVRELEAVLAHELAHVKRHDYAVNLLQSVTEMLYFFHPALWWLSARVREEREHCCDDLAVQVCGGDGRILAQALAHVEELRLTQTSLMPALAMGFASNRQHLLHRVRRMLGVPTRPFVSTGSLAGLTLATILFMSISVYGVQKQHQPKPGKKRPAKVVFESGRRDAEFSISDGKTLDYVIWKGKKLPAKRIAGLQHQFDKVMSGQLSLDEVKQPDRDILLAVIETNNSYTDAVAKEIPAIDYNQIVASALTNIPLSPDGTVEGLAKVDYGSIIRDAMESVAQVMPSSLDSSRKLRTYNQLQFDSLTLLITQRVDSLSRLMAQRSVQAQKIQLQLEQSRFPIEKLQRSQEVLNWRKDKLMAQRDGLLEKHERFLRNAGKQKLSTAEIEKQVAALEPEIQKLEGSMEELNQQFERINAQQEEAKAPINQLEREAQQLEQQVDELSDQLEKQGAALERMVPDVPDLDEDVHLEGAARLNRLPAPARPPRPARAVTPAKFVTAPRPVRSAVKARALPIPARVPKLDPPAPPAKPE